MEALLCIDMQNDFCVEGAPLQVAGALKCLPCCQTAVKLARDKGVPVIWIIREHSADGNSSCGRLCTPAHSVQAHARGRTSTW